MFYRFFAKKTHPDLEKIIPLLSEQLSLNPQHWTVKQQPATYQQGYSLVAQGHGMTLSFYENALKEQERGQQTELLVACENAPWLTLIAQAPQQESSQRQRLDVKPLPPQAAWEGWNLYSNQEELGQYLLASLQKQHSIFKNLEAVEFSLERQRLYLKWPWLPDTPTRQEQLRATISFARALVTALDEVATASSE